ncbi:polysaccharide deacetylase family protein [Mesorhizobium sp. VNQ89]|uniref:polysaccharide deacetylase family protein n=1 Tax=Mesorhizobium quangtriensis TaxID=3157709 RepID=UPI0032B74C4C
MSKSKKRVVIHEDDVGMSHGANMAFVELSKLGTCSSGSVMVPCPWFPEAAELATKDASLDVGVHLTLTSEQKPYRWRPLTSPPKSAGLTDDYGYFWPTVPQARKAHPEAVEAELRAQIDVAVAAGIDITHFDCHMGTAQMPEFTAILRKLGAEYRQPVLLVKDLSKYNPASYAGQLDVGRYDAEIVKAKAIGEPVFDIVLETPWARKTDAKTAYYEMFKAIPDGLTFLSLHFNTVGDFETINPPDAHLRTEEYELFAMSSVIKDWIAEFDVEVIGMRTLRDDLRANVYRA